MPGRPRPLTEGELALIAVRFALTFDKWVLRRVEQVVFIDDRMIRHRESVTFRWPEPDFFGADEAPRAGQTIFLPLDLVEKRPLIDVDVARPNGSTLPILPSRRTAWLSAEGLTAAIWALAEQRDGGLSERTVQVIDGIVRSRPEIASRLLSLLDDHGSELGRVLDQRDEFSGLLRELASNFLLIVPLVYEPGVEVVVKYSYAQRLHWRMLPRRWSASVGLTDLEVRLTRLGLGYAQSYHLELVAPDDVELARVQLYGSYVDSSGSDRVHVMLMEDGCKPIVDLHARRPTAATLRRAECLRGLSRRVLRHVDPPAPPSDPVGAAQAAAPTPVQRSDRGFAYVSLRAPVIGPLTAGTVTSVLTCALLAYVRGHLSGFDSEVGATLLLVLPSLAASYFTRPGEHAFATRLLVGSRAGAIVVGVCSLAIAMVLVGSRLSGSCGESVQEVERITAWPFRVAILVTIVLCAGLLRTWSRWGKAVDDPDPSDEHSE